jgi:uncharacterized protein YggE
MTRAILATLVIGSIAAPAGVRAAQTPTTPTTPTVVTEGSATVKRAPDQAWLTIATDTRDAQADAARRKSSASLRAVQDALRQAGLPADAIRTTGFSLMPDLEWNNGRSTVRGYVVRNQIEARIDALDRLGQVIDAVNATGDTTVTISGPRFALKDQSEAEREALQQAVQAALARADAIAAGAHRAIGAIVKIEDHTVSGPAPRFMATEGMRAAQAPTPITPGEIEIRAEVSLTVELR